MVRVADPMSCLCTPPFSWRSWCRGDARLDQTAMFGREDNGPGIRRDPLTPLSGRSTMSARQPSVLLAAFWLALLGPATAGAPRPDVAAELKRYYEDGKQPPAWEAAVKRLAAGAPEQRQAAAAYLRALLA